MWSCQAISLTAGKVEVKPVVTGADRLDGGAERREQALAYLARHTVMSLATYGQQGLWAAAVFYASDQFDLYFLSAGHTRHGQNLNDNARAAATIQENYSDWPAIQGIQLEGDVRLLSAGRRDAAIALYLDKFAFLRQTSPTLQSQLEKVNWYCLRPDRLYFVDNSLGFGHRDEIELSMIDGWQT
jgi:uncharacterized protein YhbP (UPF0306 family)